MSIYDCITFCMLLPWNPSFSATDRHCFSVTPVTMSTGSCEEIKIFRNVTAVNCSRRIDYSSNISFLFPY